MFDTKVEIIFDMDKIINNIKDSIINFFPYDFIPKLLLASMTLIFVFGLLRLYEINKKEETADKHM